MSWRQNVPHLGTLLAPFVEWRQRSPAVSVAQGGESSSGGSRCVARSLTLDGSRMSLPSSRLGGLTESRSRVGDSGCRLTWRGWAIWLECTTSAWGMNRVGGTRAAAGKDMDVWATYSCSLLVPSGPVHGWSQMFHRHLRVDCSWSWPTYIVPHGEFVMTSGWRRKEAEFGP